MQFVFARPGDCESCDTNGDQFHIDQTDGMGCSNALVPLLCYETNCKMILNEDIIVGVYGAYKSYDKWETDYTLENYSNVYLYYNKKANKDTPLSDYVMVTLKTSNDMENISVKDAVIDLKKDTFPDIYLLGSSTPKTNS